MRPIAYGRIVGLIVATAGLGTSAYFARESARLNAEFHQWLDDRPMQAEVDLSKPGEISVPFRQTCSVSHGEAIYLSVTPPLDSYPKPDSLLYELSAKIIIKDREGNEIIDSEIAGKRAQRRDGETDILLAFFYPFSKGDYTATIHVDSGVAELAGKQQVLYAKYFLCGLEQFPAIIAGVFSFVSGAIGLIAAVVVLPGLWRQGFRRVPPNPD